MRLAGDWAPLRRKVLRLPWTSPLIANLEGPVLPSESNVHKLPKAGPYLSNKTLPTGPELLVFILANNHIMDYGHFGLSETLQAISSLKAHAVGAGQNAQEASHALFFDWRGIRIAVIARCEVQFGIASCRKAGVSALDATVYRSIKEIKRKADIVIASVHAAAETAPWPSPKRQITFRALVEAGADLVHGHHAHVPQGWEVYEGGYIFYGLGNFCVDPETWSGHKNALWSLVPEIGIQNGRLTVSPATAVIEELEGVLAIRDANLDESKTHQWYLRECNRPLSDHTLLESIWQEASVRMYQSYYGDWLEFQKIPTYLRRNKLSTPHMVLHAARKLASRFFPKTPRSEKTLSQQRLWHVLFACESHQEAIATALGVLSGVIEDLRSHDTARIVTTMMPFI